MGEKHFADVSKKDTISRQAAIDALAKFVPYAICDESTESYTNGLTDAYNLICQLPSINPEQRWIPCSERLPSDEDYDETFTVTIQCEHYDGWDDYVTGYADWTPHGWDIQSYYIGQIKVVAWMPLPEPYKGEHDERD